MEGEEIFGSCKQKVNLAPESKGDSHRHDCVNFFHLHVNHTITKSSVDIEQPIANQIQDVEVLEAPCGNGVWHIERCSPMLHVQCFALQKSIKHFYVIRIFTELISIGVVAPIFLGLWS
jgi:hypothetical protein